MIIFFRLAYNYLKKYKESVECYKKAVELEPIDTYKDNLKKVEDLLASSGSPGPSTKLQLLSNLFNV